MNEGYVNNLIFFYFCIQFCIQCEFFSNVYNLEGLDMSEDVKPRLKTTDETFGLMARTEIVNWIELEPTMRLMDEMAEPFQEWLDDTEVDFSEQPGWKSCKEVLEKYRKFKEEVK